MEDEFLGKLKRGTVLPFEAALASLLPLEIHHQRRVIRETGRQGHRPRSGLLLVQREESEWGFPVRTREAAVCPVMQDGGNGR